MRIFIVSAHYDNRSRIGSARPRSFAKWLSTFGHEVTVLTQSANGPYDSGTEEGSAGVQVVRIPRAKFLDSVHGRAQRVYSVLRQRTDGLAVKSSAQGDANWSGTPPPVVLALTTISLLFRVLDDRLWIRESMRVARELSKADVIFATYGPLSALWLGRALARWQPSAVLVTDFRDLVVNDSFPRLVNTALLRVQRSAVAESDEVTTISEGLAGGLVAASPNQSRKVHFLPNGFERSDPAPDGGDPNISPPAGALRIGYTGNMYSGRRDASILFEALDDLNRAGLIDTRNVVIEYAGRDGAVFTEQASAFGLEGLVRNHGMLSKDQTLALQSVCHLLLVLSWNTREQVGILTGKVFEYLGADRPIIALTGGDLPGAELTALVRNLGVGFALEYARRAADYPAFKDFLLQAYSNAQDGKLVIDSFSEAVESYDYEAISRRLEGLLQRAVSEKRFTFQR